MWLCVFCQSLARSIMTPFHHHKCPWHTVLLPLLGLLITYVALNLMDGHGQPALLYIVPFTIGKWCPAPYDTIRMYDYFMPCLLDNRLLFFVLTNYQINLCRNLLSTRHEERWTQKPVDERSGRESVHAHALAPIPEGLACCSQLAVVNNKASLGPGEWRLLRDVMEEWVYWFVMNPT